MIERSNERCCLVTLSITLGSSLCIEQQNRDCGRAMGASHSPPNTSVSPGNRTSLTMWRGGRAGPWPAGCNLLREARIGRLSQGHISVLRPAHTPQSAGRQGRDRDRREAFHPGHHPAVLLRSPESFPRLFSAPITSSFPAERSTLTGVSSAPRLCESPRYARQGHLTSTTTGHLRPRRPPIGRNGLTPHRPPGGPFARPQILSLFPAPDSTPGCLESSAEGSPCW